MKSEKGQTLLIVVFSMSLGLLVMVSTANRALGSVARTTQTNYYQKAVAAGEAGAEIYLSSSDLDTSMSSCPASNLLAAGFPVSFPSSCIVGFTDSRAFVGLEYFPSGTESFNVNSIGGETIHINLQNLANDANVIRVCWYGVGNLTYSSSYYFMYSGSLPTYVMNQDLIGCSSSNTWCAGAPAGYDDNNTKEAQADGGYSCYQVDVPSQPMVLRVFTFPGGASYKISAIEVSGSSIVAKSLPPQGYRIISIGEVKSGVTGVGSLESKKATRRKVVVEKTFPYPAGPWWDFALTSTAGKVHN